MGLGSLIYTLTTVAGLIRELALVDTARSLSTAINEDTIAADTVFDIMGGSAGALLGLAALYSAAPESATLARMEACGARLIAGMTTNPPRAWPGQGVQPLTGFSHGAAGIAYALLRLQAVSPDGPWRDAAQEGISYERSVFAQDLGNWPDFRDATLTFKTSWCHGAPGIGLARLGGLAMLNDAALHAEIATALATTQSRGWGGVDFLCCGNFGRLEVQLVAARVLGDVAGEATVREVAGSLIARAARVGGYSLSMETTRNIFIPGFFLGIAGIGYQLLRLVEPDLPCVLLLN